MFFILDQGNMPRSRTSMVSISLSQSAVYDESMLSQGKSEHIHFDR
jgi:hypothetical protein